MHQPDSKTVLGITPHEGQIRFRDLFSGKGLGLGAGTFFLILSVLVSLALPRLTNGGVQLIEAKEAFEWNFLGSWQVKVTTLWPIVLLMIGFAVLYAVTRTLSRVYLFNVGREVERDTRRMVFWHLSTLSPNFYGKHNIGDLMSRLTNDIGNIRLAAGFGLLNSLNIIIICVGTLPILISIDWRVATAALTAFPLVMITAKLVSGRMFRVTQAYQQSLSNLTTHVQENLSGIPLIKAFHQEKAEVKRFEVPNKAVFDAGLDQSKIRVIMFPLTRAMAGLSVVMTLYVGGYGVVHGWINVGDFVEINLRLGQLAWPAISMGFIIAIHQRGKASLARLQELLNESPTVVDGHHTSPSLRHIHVEGLGFRQDTRAIENISFTLSHGETLGIVGPRGSGKSTLIAALTRQMNTNSGSILYDSIDAKDWKLESLFKRIGLVGQEPILFSATIRENIAFGRPDATESEIMELIEQVGLAKDLQTLPNGLDTMIGEKGVMLSGGQRQRVAIARAICTRADLIILDDALSAVDAETEQHILTSLRTIDFKPMLIISSHRLSAVAEAKEILVMDEGKIVERGDHTRLLSKNNLYAALWGIEKLEAEIEGGVK